MVDLKSYGYVDISDKMTEFEIYELYIHKEELPLHHDENDKKEDEKLPQKI